MVFRLQEALDLRNARAKASDKEVLSKTDLGRILYPEAKKPHVNIWVLLNGSIQTVKLEHVQIICKVLSVDANFLFGFPSKHDNDFKKIRAVKK